MRLALTIARRELRGGIRGFRVFLLCLVLGVAAIAAVATVRAAITGALTDQGRALLGGDAQVEITYRTATPEERIWLAAWAERVSEVLTFRSMVRAGDEFALAQVKAVDGGWPLVGEAAFDPPMTVARALENDGAAMEKVLADRLGLAPGDRFRLGEVEFTLSAILMAEPDNASGGFALAPRLLIGSAAAGPLTGPGAVYDAEYRMILPPGTALDPLRVQAEAAFPGARWQDSRRPAPGIERNANRIGAFLILLGLAGLAVGGVGIAAATRAWIARKTGTIATLRALGATGGEIRAAFLIQLALLAVAGIAGGLALGVAVPVALGPLIAGAMPVTLTVAPSWSAMAEAAVYGALVAALAVMLPLTALSEVRPAVLYRDTGPGRGGRLPLAALAGIVALALALVAAAMAFSGEPWLALGTLAGIAVALGFLWAAALGLRRLARALAPRLRGWPALRAALGAIGGPQGDAAAVVLSLGLGLSVLAAVGQVQSNLATIIDQDLPARAPAYFVIDIQPDQIGPLRAQLAAMPEVERVQSAPMLRGVLTRINGREAREVAGDHWVLRGDRGLSYAATPDAGTRIVAGQWWPADYTGPPQVSVAAREAAELGLKLGDRITVNVLGRDIEAEITSLRDVDFRADGIGFVLVLNPAALAGAPHTEIATIYASPAAEAGVLRAVATAYPNITAIPVREAIDRVGEALAAVGRASLIAAAVTLATGFVVLIGAAAAGEQARAWEAAILKVLGASRATILASFALRAGLTGAAAGGVALIFGAGAGWAVMHFVMEAPYRFAPGPALAVVLGGAAATLVAGLLFALRPLAARPAGVLRATD